MSDYKQYQPETPVLIIETREEGEAFEYFAGYISAFVGEETRCRYYKLDEVEFLKPVS